MSQRAAGSGKDLDQNRNTQQNTDGEVSDDIIDGFVFEGYGNLEVYCQQKHKGETVWLHNKNADFFANVVEISLGWEEVVFVASFPKLPAVSYKVQFATGTDRSRIAFVTIFPNKPSHIDWR